MIRFAVWLLILLPVVEIWLLIEIGSEIGSFATIATLILTAVIGLGLIRWQGFTTLLRAQGRMASGEVPAAEMMEGLVLAVCGLALLIPGFATDVVGLLGLIPPVRRYLLGPWLRALHVYRSPHYRPPGDGHTLEGNYRREDDPRR